MSGFLHTRRQAIEELVETGLVVAAVVPCYNVAAHIERVVHGIPPYIRDIILVNDASRDGTPQILESLQCNRVHVVHLPVNQGVGGAMLAGYEKACLLGADIAVKLDGDGQMNPAYIPNLLFPILERKANYSKGNRFLHTRELRAMPLTRRIGNLGLSFLAKLASGYWNVFDPTNGFTALDLSMLSIINLDRIDRRYFFETSFLMELGLQRAVVQDVYIPAFYGNEKSSLSTLKTLLDFPPKLLAALFRRIIVTYFIRDFNMFALFAISGTVSSLFGFLWGLYHWVTLSAQNIAASTGTVMIAVLPLMIGIQLLLQAVVMDIQNVPTQVLGD